MVCGEIGGEIVCRGKLQKVASIYTCYDARDRSAKLGTAFFFFPPSSIEAEGGDVLLAVVLFCCESFKEV